MPNCDVKADGKVLNNDPYTYRGLGWNSGEGKFRIAVSGEMESYDNFVSGVLLSGRGSPTPTMPTPPFPAGADGRSFWASRMGAISCAASRTGRWG